MSEKSSNDTYEDGLNVPEDLIEIRDPEIDAQQIMAEIRERIKLRRKEVGYERMSFPSYARAVMPGRPEDVPYDANLYHHLQLANKLYTEADTDPDLAASPAGRIPVLGQLWRLIRREAHHLVLFYVNRAINHEIDVNRHIISVENLLTAEIQGQQRTLLALNEEVDRLRTRFED